MIPEIVLLVLTEKLQLLENESAKLRVYTCLYVLRDKIIKCTGNRKLKKEKPFLLIPSKRASIIGLEMHQAFAFIKKISSLEM